MAINYTAIQSILDTQLQTITDLPVFTEENIKATQMSTKPFSRSTLLPAQTAVIGIGHTGWRMDQGNYQVDLFYPINKGYNDASTMGDKVMNAYERGTYYTGSGIQVLIDKVYKLPSIQAANSTYYKVSIMVSWQFFDTK